MVHWKCTKYTNLFAKISAMPQIPVVLQCHIILESGLLWILASGLRTGYATGIFQHIGMSWFATPTTQTTLAAGAQRLSSVREHGDVHASRRCTTYSVRYRDNALSLARTSSVRVIIVSEVARVSILLRGDVRTNSSMSLLGEVTGSKLCHRQPVSDRLYKSRDG